MRNLRRVTFVMGLLAVTCAMIPHDRRANIAQAMAPSELEVEVRQLLTELSGATREQRSLAEKRLLELGPRVLPLLPAPELLPSASVREAVRRVRVELERRAARESVLPSRVTLDQTLSVREALAEIARQTGNPLDGSPLPEKLLEQPVDAVFKSVSFWDVLDDLSARLKVRYEYDSSKRGLKLKSLEADNRPSASALAYAGAFRLEALPAERIRRGSGRVIDQKFRAHDDLARVTLTLMPEPRLRPLFLQFAAKDVSAQLATGLALKAFSPDASYELPLGEGGGLSRIQLEYVLPESVPGAALKLKGKLRCMTAAGNETIRFTDLADIQDGRAANIARRRGGVTVTLNRVRASRVSPGKTDARIQVTVAYDAGGPAFESHQAWILHNEVFLEDPAGGRVRLNGGSDTKGQGDGGVLIEYRFANLPDPLPNYGFVYVVPTLIIDVPVEFEIQSLLVKKP
jgi:hypothetical protein